MLHLSDAAVLAFCQILMRGRSDLVRIGWPLAFTKVDEFSRQLGTNFLEGAAGGLLSPLGPSPLCDYLSISDNSLLLYIVNEL